MGLTANHKIYSPDIGDTAQARTQMFNMAGSIESALNAVSAAQAQQIDAKASEIRTGLSQNLDSRFTEAAQSQQSELDAVRKVAETTQASMAAVEKLANDRTFKDLVSSHYGLYTVGQNFRGIQAVALNEVPDVMDELGVPQRGDSRLLSYFVSPENAPVSVSGNFRGQTLGAGNSSSSNSSVRPCSKPEVWVHYGDSLTDWGSPEALAKLTGFKHINAGIASDLSSQIAIRSGGWPYSVKIAGGTIPASGSVNITAHRPVELPQPNGTKHPVSIAGVNGEISHPSGGASAIFTRSAAGSSVSIGTGWVDVTLDPLVPTPKQTQGNVEGASLIIGVGRNDALKFNEGGNIETVLASIRKIIEANSARAKHVIVWSIPPWSWETIGTNSRKRLDEWNAKIAAAFPEYFVDVPEKLRTDEAFVRAGIQKTEQDTQDISQGLTPQSFRRDTAGHFNDIGNNVWASFMLDEMKKRGYFIG